MAKKKNRKGPKSGVAKLGRRIGGLKRSVKALKKKVSKIKPKRKKAVKTGIRVVRAPARNIRITVAAERKRKAKRKKAKRARKAFRVPRVSSAQKRIFSLENKVRLLESRFREHLEELRKLPSIAHEEKFAEVHKRLDEHERHRKNIQATVDELHAGHSLHRKTENELAHDIVDLYFREIARHGFKRSLSLEDTLNAYDFVKKKLKEHMAVSAGEIEKAIEEKKQEVKTY